MNKKVIMPIVLMTLIGLSVFVVAAQMDKEIPGYGVKEGDYEKKSVTVYGGWNLIMGFGNPDWIEGGDISPSQIKAVFALDPFTKEYIRFYPENPDLKNVDVAMDYLLSSTAYWVYIDADKESLFKLEYYTLKSYPLDEMQMFEGWNFVGISEEFRSYSLNQLKGDCDVSKVGTFDMGTSSWDMMTKSQRDKKFFIDNSIYEPGRGMLIKVSNGCTLGLSVALPEIPEIPEDIGECEDPDGMAIDNKVTVTNGIDTKIDYCVNDTVLREYMCESSGEINSIDFDCSTRGFNSCSEGECIN